MSSGELGRRKWDLRASVRSMRDALTPEERSRRAAAIEERLFGLPEVLEARTVMAFSSFGSEVPTQAIIERLAAEGRRVALPKVVEGEMHAAAYRPGDPVVLARYGAMEPRDLAPIPPEEIDVVITPGLAFDRSGHRVGYGGGFFDRFFRRTRPDALRVGICFAIQVVEAVPRGGADAAVDLVVTETETIECRRGPAA